MVFATAPVISRGGTKMASGGEEGEDRRFGARSRLQYEPDLVLGKFYIIIPELKPGATDFFLPKLELILRVLARSEARAGTQSERHLFLRSTSGPW